MESRGKILIIAVVVLCLIIVVRLFYIQVLDSSYKIFANNNALRYQIQFPPRGEVYDRNGEFLVQSKEAYDLLCIPREVTPFDTVRFASIIGVEVADVRAEIQKARKYSTRRPSVLFKQLSKEVKLRLEERRFRGFFTQYRTVRTYPTKMAGNLLGYVGEVDDRDMSRDPYYKMGDFIGKTGIEKAYEEQLRGIKGVKVELVDVHGMPKGAYQDGVYDTLAQPGRAIYSTIDGKLQQLAEELLQGKVGAVVAIEPATGEILVMANSPSYDPDLLVGRDRSKNYARMVFDPRQPLYNRAVMSSYPPGSTFKTVNGLIGMQLGVATENDLHSCPGGYPMGGIIRPKCHAHYSPLNMSGAVANSCNAYFAYVFRDILDRGKVAPTFRERYDIWREYVMSFGFGRKLDSDFTGERNGNVPSADYYNRIYNNRWNSYTVISLSIGQGEMGCTPLQMANMAAIIANRGYYYIPHVVKKIEGRDTINSRFTQRHYTKVAPEHFNSVVEGMYQAVNVAGTATIARVAGLDICGKTGTAQNPQGVDHSVFMSFAPRDNPKIAIYVFIEHGRSGATTAAPIASLLAEQYLTDTIKRPDMVEYVKNMQVHYPMYDRVGAR